MNSTSSEEILNSCAHAIGPYLFIKDIITLARLSKNCNKSFTDPQVWHLAFSDKDVQFSSFSVTNPYTFIKKKAEGLNVAGHWKFYSFESCKPALILDYSGNKNHLLLENGNFDYRQGIKNGIKVLKGPYCARAKVEKAFDTRDNMTVEIIVKKTQPHYHSDYPVISKVGPAGLGSEGGWEIVYAGDCISFQIKNQLFPLPARVQYTNRLFNNFNHFYHIAGSYDGTQLILYINGEVVSTSATRKVPKHADSKVPLTIGAGAVRNTRNNFEGIILEARVTYNTLKPDQFICTPAYINSLNNA